MEGGIEQRTPGAFPPLLREIPDPPDCLYIRGTMPRFDNRFLCVVGSRKYTPYGKELCKKLIRGLSGYPIAIISGLALGIDGIAHEAALDAGLPTVAVPGSGLSDRVLYPRTNVRLAHRILESGGALLSEFPPDHRPRPENFPQRNRIMAALSHAVMVVEAEERSGTLITARLALEYNRDVLAVPGPLLSPTSRGPHYLIRNGALLVRSSDDILEALQLESLKATAAERRDLSDAERRVLELLKLHRKRDVLIAALGITAMEANILLSSMEIKGIITEELGELREKQ